MHASCLSLALVLDLSAAQSKGSELQHLCVAHDEVQLILFHVGHHPKSRLDDDSDHGDVIIFQLRIHPIGSRIGVRKENWGNTVPAYNVKRAYKKQSISQ